MKEGDKVKIVFYRSTNIKRGVDGQWIAGRWLKTVRIGVVKIDPIREAIFDEISGLGRQEKVLAPKKPEIVSGKIE